MMSPPLDASKERVPTVYKKTYTVGVSTFPTGTLRGYAGTEYAFFSHAAGVLRKRLPAFIVQNFPFFVEFGTL